MDCQYPISGVNMKIKSLLLMLVLVLVAVNIFNFVSAQFSYNDPNLPIIEADVIAEVVFVGNSSFNQSITDEIYWLRDGTNAPPTGVWDMGAIALRFGNAGRNIQGIGNDLNIRAITGVLDFLADTMDVVTLGNTDWAVGGTLSYSATEHNFSSPAGIGDVRMNFKAAENISSLTWKKENIMDFSDPWQFQDTTLFNNTARFPVNRSLCFGDLPTDQICFKYDGSVFEFLPFFVTPKFNFGGTWSGIDYGGNKLILGAVNDGDAELEIVGTNVIRLSIPSLQGANDNGIFRVSNPSGRVTINLENDINSVAVLQYQQGQSDHVSSIAAASVNQYFFEGSTSGETKDLRTYGFPTGDSLRFVSRAIDENARYKINGTYTGFMLDNIETGIANSTTWFLCIDDSGKVFKNETGCRI